MVRRVDLMKINKLIDKRIGLLKKFRDVTKAECVGIDTYFEFKIDQKVVDEPDATLKDKYFFSNVFFSDGSTGMKPVVGNKETNVSIPASDTVKAFVLQYLHDQIADIDVELYDLGVTFEEHETYEV